VELRALFAHGDARVLRKTCAKRCAWREAYGGKKL